MKVYRSMQMVRYVITQQIVSHRVTKLQQLAGLGSTCQASITSKIHRYGQLHRWHYGSVLVAHILAVWHCPLFELTSLLRGMMSFYPPVSLCQPWTENIDTSLKFARQDAILLPSGSSTGLYADRHLVDFLFK